MSQRNRATLYRRKKLPKVGQMPRYKYTVCEIRKYFWGVTNYQSRRAHHTPLGGIFVIYEVGHAKIYQCTKFEVSNYTCSKCTKWVPKFTNLAPRPITPVAPLGYFVIK